MSKYIDSLFDASAPNAEPGQTFTASQGPNVMPPRGVFLDKFRMTIFGDVATAPVTIETVAAAMSQFTFKAGQETRIQLNFQDMIAVMAAYYRKLPKIWENSDNTGTSYIAGVEIPVHEVIDRNITYSWSANYASQTNFTVVKMVLEAEYLSVAPAKKPKIIVPISWTTPGSTGMSAINARLQNLGSMIGLLLFNTTLYSDGLDVTEVQRLQLVESGKQTSMLNTLNSQNFEGQCDYGDLAPIGETLQNYTFWDFTEDPINVKDQYLEFIADVQATSGAVRLIPIIEKA